MKKCEAIFRKDQKFVTLRDKLEVLKLNDFFNNKNFNETMSGFKKLNKQTKENVLNYMLSILGGISALDAEEFAGDMKTELYYNNFSNKSLIFYFEHIIEVSYDCFLEEFKKQSI